MSFQENTNCLEALPRVLSIAGSDSGGGAGIQADLKTISALGCYGSTVITALTAQNTKGVDGIHPVTPDFVKLQLDSVLDDIGADSIKIGMLGNGEIIKTIAEKLKEKPGIPIVLDPVMVATSGDRLINQRAVTLLKELLFPIATVITPNILEAEVLSGLKFSVDGELAIAQALLKQTNGAVLIKGGHALSDVATDSLYFDDGNIVVQSLPRIDTLHTHGTGCTLSSAIASYLAKGETLENSFVSGKIYLHGAINSGKDGLVGAGRSPVNHLYRLLE